MENTYFVAIHYNEELGYVKYNEIDKKADVVLADEIKKAEVEAFLAKTHEIRVPRETLMDFVNTEVNALADIESFKLALTRLWGQTGVYVDWSRPVAVCE